MNNRSLFSFAEKIKKKYKGKLRNKPEMSQPYFINIYFTDTLYCDGWAVKFHTLLKLLNIKSKAA